MEKRVSTPKRVLAKKRITTQPVAIDRTGENPPSDVTGALLKSLGPEKLRSNTRRQLRDSDILKTNAENSARRLFWAGLTDLSDDHKRARDLLTEVNGVFDSPIYTLVSRMRQISPGLRGTASLLTLSITDMIESKTRASLPALRTTKDLGKVIWTNSEPVYSQEVGTVMYYWSIAFARVRFRQNITSLSEAERKLACRTLSNLIWVPAPVRWILAQSCKSPY